MAVGLSAGARLDRASNPPAIDGTTWCLWWYETSHPVTLSGVFGLGSVTQRTYVLEDSATSTYHMGGSGGAAAPPDIDTGYSSATSTWHFAAQSVSGTTFNCYIRSITDSSFTTATDDASSSSYVATSWYRCGAAGITSNRMDGYVAGVKIWEAVLTEDELWTESQRLTPVRFANLHSCYPLIGNHGTQDIGPNGYAFTEVGSPTVQDGPPITWGAPVWVVPFIEAGGATLSVNVSDGVTLGESTSVTPLALPGIDVSDGVTLGETVTATMTDLVLSAVDALTVGESLALQLSSDVSVSDGVTLGESVAVTPLALPGISVEDGVTLGESVAVSIGAAGAFEISVSDGVTLGEAVTITMADLTLSATDATTLGDSAAAVMADLALSVTDAVTLGESVSVSVVAVGVYTVSVSDGFTVGDTVTASMADLALSATDAITLGESVTVSTIAAGVYQISVTDAFTVGDSASITPLALPGISVADAITVGESSNVWIEGSAYTISVSDGFTVAELIFALFYVTPGRRIYEVPSESRTFTVPAVSRTYTPSEE
jgi:hypothetical protein